MKANIYLLTTALLFSTHSYASSNGDEPLQLQKIMERAGAAVDDSLVHYIVSVESVQCAQDRNTKESSCTLGLKNDKSAKLTVEDSALLFRRIAKVAEISYSEDGKTAYLQTQKELTNAGSYSASEGTR